MVNAEGLTSEPTARQDSANAATCSDTLLYSRPERPSVVPTRAVLLAHVPTPCYTPAREAAEPMPPASQRKRKGRGRGSSQVHTCAPQLGAHRSPAFATLSDLARAGTPIRSNLSLRRGRARCRSRLGSWSPQMYTAPVGPLSPIAEEVVQIILPTVAFPRTCLEAAGSSSDGSCGLHAKEAESRVSPPIGLASLAKREQNISVKRKIDSVEALASDVQELGLMSPCAVLSQEFVSTQEQLFGFGFSACAPQRKLSLLRRQRGQK